MNGVKEMSLVEQSPLTLILIDLSSIAYPTWMTSASEPDPNATSIKIVARVRALANDQPHVAVCCDKGRSFRHELAATYKANRPEREAALHHQIDLAIERLKADGFPVWAVPGFEADDLVATATERALALPDMTVRIVSRDKDLLQLVGPRVIAMSALDGTLVDEEAVIAKFGVRPNQMRDYLTIVGDASDNVTGIKGVGSKGAVKLLATFGTLDAVYAAIKDGSASLSASIASALRDFEAQLPLTRRLIQLRTDADVPFEEISRVRVPQDIATAEFADAEDDGSSPATPILTEKETEEAIDGARHAKADGANRGGTAIAIRRAEVLVPEPAEWERQLDPRSLGDAKALATDMFNSRMFSAYGNQQAVLSTVMVGRELGLPAMASLRSVHVIEGKHSLSASLMVALVLRSGLAEYFEPISFSETEATYETKRKGARNPIGLTHTFEMAKKAWPKSKDGWEKAFLASGWGRNPTDLLVARASSRLARMVYPDLLAGMFTPEELAEIRAEAA